MYRKWYLSFIFFSQFLYTTHKLSYRRSLPTCLKEIAGEVWGRGREGGREGLLSPVKSEFRGYFDERTDGCKAKGVVTATTMYTYLNVAFDLELMHYLV